MTEVLHSSELHSTASLMAGKGCARGGRPSSPPQSIPRARTASLLSDSAYSPQSVDRPGSPALSYASEMYFDATETGAPWQPPAHACTP